MKFGVTVNPATLPPGRIIIRKDANDLTLGITTDWADKQDGELVAVFRVNRPVGFVLKSALRDVYWDVTEFVQLRPDLTTHAFSYEAPAHGETFTVAGKLMMVGIRNDNYGTADPLQFEISTGKQAAVDMASVVRFARWRLIAVNEKGDDVAELYKWPPVQPPSATASY